MPVAFTWETTVTSARAVVHGPTINIANPAAASDSAPPSRNIRLDIFFSFPVDRLRIHGNRLR
jgi:hypothetical protein